MVDTGDAQKKVTDADRQKTLDELKALREKRLDASKPSQPSPQFGATTKPAQSQPKNEGETVDISAARREDDDATIAALRSSRMQAEAYHDVVKLRKKAHAHEHKASKFQTKSKSHETKAQRAITRAVGCREKATNCREKIKDLEARVNDYAKDLGSSASGETSLPPEKIKLKMAKLEGKIASLQQRARKYEAKAAMQNERAAGHRSKAAFNLEQGKIQEAEAKNFTKRADNLEKAGL